MADRLQPTYNLEPCEKCGGRQAFIPYQDAAGCGSVTIELWRCEDCGQARYGDTIDFATTCDFYAND